jgi:peptide/nickel transport system permease protein
MILFGVQLGWLPISGLTSMGHEEMSFWGQIWDYAEHLTMPVLISSVLGLAGVSRYTRASMLEVIRQDYITTARAKGLKESNVIYSHAMRNALMPIITILGLSLPGMIGGAVIYETIFAIPGMGKLGFDAVMSRDYPVIMGVLVIIRGVDPFWGISWLTSHMPSPIPGCGGNSHALGIHGPAKGKQTGHERALRGALAGGGGYPRPADHPFAPNDINVDSILLNPSWTHPFGTDELGRDVYTRMVYGARISLYVGIIAAGLATLIGVILGSLAGYYGGWVETVIMRFTDIMLCFPSFFLILTIIAVLDPMIENIMAVIGLTGWMGTCRLVRAEFLSLKEREYVLAAQSLGASDIRVIFRHILPNAMAPVLVSLTFGVAGAILTESGLSFLGLGVQPPDPSWGNILTQGKSAIEIAWWLSVYPGLAILVTVLGYNLLGEGIRDALDPRLY